MALMKINIFWTPLVKELSHFSQKRQSADVLKYWKSTKFRLSHRFYKVTTSPPILTTTLYRPMIVLHENIHIYRGLNAEKIPSLGQCLQSKIAKIQFFGFHSNDF